MFSLLKTSVVPDSRVITVFQLQFHTRLDDCVISPFPAENEAYATLTHEQRSLEMGEDRSFPCVA